MELKVKDVLPNPWNPRLTDDVEDLVDSIKKRGVLQPILVRKHPKFKDKFEIVFGYRRWLACKKLGLKTIPAIISELSDYEAIQIMGEENIRRKAYSPVELAKYFELRNRLFGENQNLIAKDFGITRHYVIKIQNLLRLPEEVQKKIRWGERKFDKPEKKLGVITPEHGRILLRLKNPQLQIEIANRIENEFLNTRETEIIVKKILKEKTSIHKFEWICPICGKKLYVYHLPRSHTVKKR
jgi:ParB family chromosome partitioning protein